ncbi:hypothetical protein EST38_g9026 [Candolleomyces aberdarensis]|uniref:NAD(P)-binding protein n=1 Tax=Candolleomyces aberdarensis TaxID=2316362 RepID=A0A4Q2DDB1_9AGAR|nr:hypothetical protein EST38_g9026 [Candolleomyces aberdarensis]
MGTSSSKPTAEKFDPKKDLVDLKGKVVIVTGGNKGIGFATVSALLRANAKVYLAARNEERAKAAIESLHNAGLGKGGDHSLGEVVWLKLDLGDPREAKKAAEEFLKLETRLDVLVNNAGDMHGDGRLGDDGVSSMQIVNYISPYVFTRTLLPLLKQTAAEPGSDVRIVNVASKVHAWIPAGVQYKELSDWNIQYSWRPFAHFLRYGTHIRSPPSILSGQPISPFPLIRLGNSKLAVVLWSRHLQAQLLASDPASPITVLAIHPGVVDTASHTMPFPGLMKWLFSFGTVPVDEGAHNSLFAAASKKIKEEPEQYRAGVYLLESPPGTITLPSAAAQDDKLGEDLIQTTEKFLKDIGV